MTRLVTSREMRVVTKKGGKALDIVSAPPSIGAQIEAAMKAQGIGVTELARRMGKDHGHVSRVVNGRMVPGAEWLQDCADVLGCELVVPATQETRYRPRGAPGEATARALCKAWDKGARR